jgi:hypothetical protein
MNFSKHAGRRMLIAALLCAGIAGPTPLLRAQLSFTFNHEPAMDLRALAGFETAAQRWSQIIADPINVTLDINFLPMPDDILGSTQSTNWVVNYSDFRAALAADRKSQEDVSAVAALQSSNTLRMLINRTSDDPSGPGSDLPYVDNNGGFNNQSIYLTQANARALGLYERSGGGSDAAISFTSRFNFDFDPTDGIDADAIDFVGIATHEIGHALGFLSGVDTLDYNSPPGPGPYPDDAFAFVMPLDLFRYSSESRTTERGLIDWCADTRIKYFSIDGGDSALAFFSSGANFGDGWQASHWTDDLGQGIMDPTAAYGERLGMTRNDALALDVIGYDLYTPAVPEPGTYAAGAVALLGVVAWRRRRAGR